ncbi:response regulator transcription factor [Roseateles depolymerans]|uniref:Response regulator with CheY-like receiver domain and winged-helix DNA-binding domain n=1 Tax=Roseateles depolymerans TaxID=76731 RepID=A0A0U3LKN2_9BURK|nr:response regulator transcription factor [Roseateles depolymerans]ALV06962.1 Response regulator with CheY-like receiver domain and winged-helix DNA-binding domain [Roseateles depolymerans]REG19942.1 DNA-binding response OmpR family regulator [Roseateles depolymerans]
MTLNRQLLLIEDDARIADFLCRGLSAEGYVVEVATTGPEGLARARASQPALIILDLMLPGLSGLELCQTLRAEGHHAAILMLTAMDAQADKVRGLRLGADDYMVKPFDFEELLARLLALQRRGREQRVEASVLRLADLEFDRERRQVRRAGRPITLTAKELAFLELLMAAPGRLFSRERILANVWGAQVDPLTNIVDVYVRRLRAKIDKDQALPLLKTVRGLGYRMDDAAE